MTNIATHIHSWIILGFIGQIIFGSRFLVQWIISEKQKESIIPEVFWYLSIAGSVVLLIYSIYRRDPVFIIGQCLGLFIYIRNVMLIYQKKNTLTNSKQIAG
ncbi:MAG: lipid-A-disaccharide synthase N-terminal domain-containing protein [Candidatus Loosdrechtia sp.]|uniref:lipid-A-disaccharide synthase N-terminal domain-containing protein n=1 Tax=Candidatus Loosdrechtia sp. TaxID=3101272 RepID=UPI003A684AF7|nr:MAG: lipid-A-disaccharide synthase N-terminal domain-containing protein [Candidatus Jettenia sp. AMX2]